MSDLKAPKEILFAPGVLEDMEKELGTDGAQELLDNLKKMFEEGTLLENSTVVDMEELEASDPALAAELNAAMDSLNTEPKRQLH